MSDSRIEGYARGLFEIARAEGTIDEVEDELFRFARSYESSEELRNALSDEQIPASKRQAIVEDLLGGKVTSTTTQLISMVVGSGRCARPAGHRRQARRQGIGGEEPRGRRSSHGGPTHPRPGDPPGGRAGQRHRQASQPEGDRRSVRAGRPRGHRRRHRHRRHSPHPHRAVEVPPLGTDTTRRQREPWQNSRLSASDIAAALKKNLEGFEPSLEARTVGRVTEVGDGIARVSGLPDCARQRVARVRGRHASAWR